MKTKRIKFRATAGRFTLLDLCLVMFATAVIVAFILPAFAKAKVHGGPMHCVNNLKQIGLSFRLWANDNYGQFPMLVPTNQGGSMEYNETAEVFRHFYPLRYQLSSPRVLVCRSDTKRTRAADWSAGFSNQNISYFVGLDADSTKPQNILSGDRNVTGGILKDKHTMCFGTNNVAGWTTDMHKKLGYIGFADGSVQLLDGNGLHKVIQAELQVVTNEVIRLAIP